MFYAFSNDYAELYPGKLSMLEKHKDELFVNDRIYDLFLDLIDVESQAYDKTLSPASSEFKTMTYEDAFIPENINLMNDPAYVIKKQWPVLEKAKAALHGTDSDFKFKYAHTLGINRIEVDLVYDKERGLCINHDKCSTDDMLFADFLKDNREGISWIVLDIKDLNQENAGDIHSELTQLDREYGLKAISLVETLYPETIPQFADEGWTTSYYLPWWELIDSDKSQEAAKTISVNIGKYAPAGISYDDRAYSAVNELVKAVKPELHQYIWDQSVSLGSTEASEQLRRYPNADAVLLPLKTYFDK